MAHRGPYLCTNLNQLEATTGQTAILMLEDGSVFYGKAIGKIGTTTGEICFNTGMTGYQEVFTDPSYFGQIVVMTSDHIGNYGASMEDTESSSIKINGLICKKYAEHFSRKLANMSLNDYFIENNIVGIANVDTRQIVRNIRSKGAMNCIISSDVLDVDELRSMLAEVPSMQGLELSSRVTTEKPFYYGQEDAPYRVAVLDLGVKSNILRCLAERGCYLKVFPSNTSYAEMKAWNPHGYMITNGPGDPGVMEAETNTLRDLISNNEKVFGICLGCQIMAQAAGMRTYKMHHGHRGTNHPVHNMVTGRSEITSQNHGFAIDPESVDTKVAKITHMNLNDNTVEGIQLVDKPAFAVQYHPESNPGPHDSRYLFDDFISLLN
ncbi:MAG: glutamine-hydrolyzing carbamoyl-phosphate synthase small subunit [Flavobacteriales bacterium]|nr:glutamine-hydrolyzing carbamoyl-phosphate synthase small subunit [Bacteroidota bacterium]MCB9240327.1 glutamine-hydrolyzing carbamoyl-phosphate synthase small subunit [Flavobacteriales bacterium]